MAPKKTAMNYRHLSTMNAILTNPNSFLNLAIENIIPGMAQQIIDTSEHLGESAMDGDVTTSDPYEDSRSSFPALRYNERTLPRQENEIKKVNEKLTRLSGDERLKKYPGLRSYIDYLNNYLTMTRDGRNTWREMARCPSGIQLLFNAVDWREKTHENAAKEFEELLSGMHFSDYFNTVRKYMDARHKLDDPTLSSTEKKRNTLLVRQSLKEMENYLDLMDDDETARKYSGYFQNYNNNIRGARGFMAVSKDFIDNARTALDMGWDPAYIEDYAQLKEFMSICSDSLIALENINDPAFDPLRQKLTAVCALNPEGRTFDNTAEFIEYYQELSDNLKGLQEITNDPDTITAADRLKREFRLNTKIKKENNKTISFNNVLPGLLVSGFDTSFSNWMDHFSEQGNFAARGIVASNGDLIYTPQILDHRSDNIKGLTQLSKQLKTSAKAYRKSMQEIHFPDDEYQEFFDYIEDLADMKAEDMSPFDLKDTMQGLKKEYNNLPQPFKNGLPNGFKAWMDQSISNLKYYTCDKVNLKEPLSEQLNTLKKLKESGASKVYIQENRTVPVHYDPEVAPFARDIKRAWKMTPDEKTELKNKIIAHNELKPDDDPMTEENMRKIAVRNAAAKGWDLKHLDVVPKLDKIMEANKRGMDQLIMVNDAPKLERLKDLMTELCRQSLRARRFDDPGKFTDYITKTHSILKEIVTESANPEVRKELLRLQQNPAYGDTIIHALTGSLSDPDTLNMKEAIEMMTPAKDRFKDTANVDDYIKKNSFERERKAITHIGEHAGRALHDFAAKLDNLFEDNSNEYMMLKNSVARVAGLKLGNHTPKRVNDCLKDLQKRAEEYEKKNKGYFKSDEGQKRLDMASELKNWAIGARASYKTALGGNMLETEPVAKQEAMFTRKSGLKPAYTDNYADDALKEMFTTTKEIFKKIHAATARLAEDEASRQTPRERRSRTYNNLLDHVRKLNSMEKDILGQRPAEIYYEMNKTMLAAKAYVDDHTGLLNLHKAQSDKGEARVTLAKNLYENLRKKMADLNMAYEGVREADPKCSIRRLAGEYGLNLSKRTKDPKGNPIGSDIKKIFSRNDEILEVPEKDEIDEIDEDDEINEIDEDDEIENENKNENENEFEINTNSNRIKNIDENELMIENNNIIIDEDSFDMGEDQKGDKKDSPDKELSEKEKREKFKQDRIEKQNESSAKNMGGAVLGGN